VGQNSVATNQKLAVLGESVAEVVPYTLNAVGMAARIPVRVGLGVAGS